ncbi:unnamed protein product [Periconia digitata]|uniref:Uncharacterized protein n=1 Tax=Periconia digitata TaxID=1303443 RepID=A0A9W4UPW7_9PLEO|nr:unnamed protein product [Periconia digitata]
MHSFAGIAMPSTLEVVRVIQYFSVQEKFSRARTSHTSNEYSRKQSNGRVVLSHQPARLLYWPSCSEISNHLALAVLL